MSFRSLIPFFIIPASFAQAPGETAFLDKIAQLEARIAALERRLEGAAAPARTVPEAKAEPAQELRPEEPETKVNLFFDGGYSWNMNRPVGRINLLRAYDATANSFGIQQTGLVLERAPNEGRRWGYRLDLMFGQATETLQGGAQNEPRPQVYRHLFQAFGTTVLPVGRGLTMDFGKWASALGPEGNYTKDQINLSRSYFFNFLPFYHTGFRATLPLTERISVAYWLVNGANQTEDFNGFKSQLGQVALQPGRNVTWTVNYYHGREQRDLTPALNPGLPTLATQPGLSVGAIRPVPRGRLHVLDTYAFWKASARLTLGAEFDHVVNRVEATGVPQTLTGGAGYLRYQMTNRVYAGQRYTRLNDRGGLFSGTAQRLSDWTSTFGYRPANGFEARLEYRRDTSNTAYFLRRTPGETAREQNTFALGLLWWFGGKTGAW